MGRGTMFYVKWVGGGVVVAALVVTVIVLAVELSKANSNTDADQPWNREYRLPSQLSPIHYDLHIHPNMVEDTFEGTASLTLQLDGPIDYLPLHQKGLNVSNPQIEQIGPASRRPRNIAVADSFDAPLNEFYIIKPAATLAAGKYKVTVSFSGSLNQPELVGIYSSTYKVSGGATPVTKDALIGLRPTLRLFFTSVLRPSRASFSMEPWDAEYRLPKGLSVEHYELFLHPNIEASTFSGRVRLHLRLSEPLKYLPVHQVGLDVRKAEVEAADGTSVALGDFFPAPKNQFVILRPKAEVFPTGQYAVRLDFTGSLQHADIVGFYASQYKDKQGNIRKLVTSKFEPTYARRAFPCLDEPDKKATFAITLVNPKKGAAPTDPQWAALSNMNVKRIENGPGAEEETTVFETSVKMSTYLACFIVSEFRYKESMVTNLDGNQFPVRTYAAAHMFNSLQFANDAANSITDFYIKYFNIDYPLPKLDLIAIPDFVSGAMEHWGLITFRETNMLVDTANSAVSTQQQVGIVVAHELAHMWFGNLVTMKWWDDLWLNEGFASYMEYKGLDHFKPDWRMLDQFVVADLQPVMVLDAQLSSHPIIQPVAHPDQITELFDSITYSKGSSVIRMLEGFLGDDIFKNGVNLYLNKFEYGNAETKDLWAALSEAAEAGGQSVDVARIMNTWTLQMGLPVVTVDYDWQTGKATLRQKRFFGSQGAEKKAVDQKESPYAYRWDIPLTYTSNVYPVKQIMNHWFKMEDATVELTFDVEKTKWFKFNLDQIGFYRVMYDSAMWVNLAEAAKGKAFSGVDRSSLLDDIFSLADGGYLEYEQALDFALYLSNENDYIAWSTASSKFLKLQPLMKTRGAYPDFKKYIEALVKTQYDASGWGVPPNPNEGHIDKRLRTSILNLACSCDYEVCKAATTQPFITWITDPTDPLKQPEPNTRQLIYNFGMERRGHENNYWDTMWELYKAETDPQEKLKLMIALTYVRDVSILNKFLTLAENEDNVRGQDYFSVLQYMSDNDIGQTVVWDYVRTNWEKLVERFTLNSRSLGRLIPRITQNFDTQLQLDEMTAFFAKYPEAGAGAAARKQALERVESNIQWVELYYNKIETWLHHWSTGPKRV